MPYSIKDGQLATWPKPEFVHPTRERKLVDAYLEANQKPLIQIPPQKNWQLLDYINKAYELVAQHDDAVSFRFNNTVACFIPIAECHHANPTNQQLCNIFRVIQNSCMTDARFGNAVALVGSIERYPQLLTAQRAYDPSYP